MQAQGPLAPPAEAVAVQDAVVAAIERCEQSVVAVQGTRIPQTTRLVVPPDRFAPLRPAEPGGEVVEHLQGEFGTGVILDASGLILTHFEVIRGVDALEVTTSERRSFPARIVGADERSGLAVLEIDASGLPAIRLGEAKGLRKGEFVVALGNPYGIAADGQASASFGIVANLGRKSTVVVRREAAASLGELGWLIQTDAKLNLGTSGGALVNLRGELVGVTTSVAATAGYDQAAGYAIPVDDAFRRIVQTLRDGREVEYGLLGVRLHPMGDRGGILGAASRGALVQEVMPGAPADRAGLKAGDVITEVAGAPVFSSDSLMLAVSQQPPLATTPIRFLRNGREQTARVELSKSQQHGEQIVTAPTETWRGLRVDFATAVENYATAARQGGTDPRGCVAVRHVEPHSPAWKAGLRTGTFISHVAHRQVSSPEEFYAATLRQSGNVTLRLPLPQNESQQVTVEGT
jgi:serine protease Do